MDIEIIEIAVNPDHVHIFFKYPPKYSLSYIAKRIKGSTSRVLRKEFPHLREWCGEHFWAPSCFHGSVGNGWDVVQKYISEIETKINNYDCKYGRGYSDRYFRHNENKPAEINFFKKLNIVYRQDIYS